MAGSTEERAGVAEQIWKTKNAMMQDSSVQVLPVSLLGFEYLYVT